MLEEWFNKILRSNKTLKQLSKILTEDIADTNLPQFIQEQLAIQQQGLDIAKANIEKIKDMQPNEIYWLEKLLRSCAIAEHSLTCLKIVAKKDKIFFAKMLYEFINEALLSFKLKEASFDDKFQLANFVLVEENDDRDLLRENLNLILIKILIEFGEDLKVATNYMILEEQDKETPAIEILNLINIAIEIYTKSRVSKENSKIFDSSKGVSSAMITAFEELRRINSKSFCDKGTQVIEEDLVTEQDKKIKNNSDNLPSKRNSKRFILF